MFTLEVFVGPPSFIPALPSHKALEATYRPSSGLKLNGAGTRMKGSRGREHLQSRLQPNVSYWETIVSASCLPSAQIPFFGNAYSVRLGPKSKHVFTLRTVIHALTSSFFYAVLSLMQVKCAPQAEQTHYSPLVNILVKSTGNIFR